MNFSDFMLQCRKDNPKHATQALFVSEGNVVDSFPLNLEVFKIRICHNSIGCLAYCIGLEAACEYNHRDISLGT